MNAIKGHKRITPEGQMMGSSTARMVERGRARLKAAGLSDINHPSMRDEMCASCAGRANTVPNGCLQTQLDFLKTVIEGKKFLCHSPMDGRMCAGFVACRAEHIAHPMPREVKALVDKWEYSPPDET